MTSTGDHQFQLADDGIHSFVFATYTSAAAREADTRTSGPRVVPGNSNGAFRQLVADDLNKIALQTDDDSLWRLHSISPLEWHPISHGHTATLGRNAHTEVAFSLEDSDSGGVLLSQNTGAVVVTIPTGLASGFWSYVRSNSSVASNAMSFVAASGVTLSGSLSGYRSGDLAFVFQISPNVYEVFRISPEILLSPVQDLQIRFPNYVGDWQDISVSNRKGSLLVVDPSHIQQMTLQIGPPGGTFSSITTIDNPSQANTVVEFDFSISVSVTAGYVNEDIVQFRVLVRTSDGVDRVAAIQDFLRVPIPDSPSTNTGTFTDQFSDVFVGQAQDGLALDVGDFVVVDPDTNRLIKYESNSVFADHPYPEGIVIFSHNPQPGGRYRILRNGLVTNFVLSSGQTGGSNGDHVYWIIESGVFKLQLNPPIQNQKGGIVGYITDDSNANSSTYDVVINSARFSDRPSADAGVGVVHDFTAAIDNVPRYESLIGTHLGWVEVEDYTQILSMRVIGSGNRVLDAVVALPTQNGAHAVSFTVTQADVDAWVALNLTAVLVWLEVTTIHGIREGGFIVLALNDNGFEDEVYARNLAGQELQVGELVSVRGQSTTNRQAEVARFDPEVDDAPSAIMMTTHGTNASRGTALIRGVTSYTGPSGEDPGIGDPIYWAVTSTGAVDIQHTPPIAGQLGGYVGHVRQIISQSLRTYFGYFNFNASNSRPVPRISEDAFWSTARNSITESALVAPDLANNGVRSNDSDSVYFLGYPIGIAPFPVAVGEGGKFLRRGYLRVTISDTTPFAAGSPVYWERTTSPNGYRLRTTQPTSNGWGIVGEVHRVDATTRGDVYFDFSWAPIQPA